MVEGRGADPGWLPTYERISTTDIVSKPFFADGMDCGTAAPERQFPLWMPRSLIAGSHKVRSLTRKALKSAAVV